MEMPISELTDDELKREYLKLKRKYHFAYMGEKRKNLVKKYGYDTKNAAHLIRLLRMCVEFLHTGQLIVYRYADAETIRDIKSGKWTLGEVKAEAELLFEACKISAAESLLPDEINFNEVNDLLVAIQESHFFKYIYDTLR